MSVVDHMKVEVDTMGLDKCKYYIAGLGRFWFSTEMDAQEALLFAKAVARSDVEGVCEDVTKLLQKHTGED
jgi:hypothetical protein